MLIMEIIIIVSIIIIGVLGILIFKKTKNYKLKINELTTNYENCYSELTNSEQTCKNLQNTLKDTEKKLQLLSTDFDTYREKSEESITKLNTEINRKEDKITSLKKSVCSYEEKYIQSSKEIEKLSFELTKTISAQDTLKNEIVTLQQKNQNYKEKLDTIKLPAISKDIFEDELQAKFNNFQNAQINFIKQKINSIQKIQTFNPNINTTINVLEFNEFFVHETTKNMNDQNITALQVILVPEIFTLLKNAGLKLKEIKYTFKKCNLKLISNHHTTFSIFSIANNNIDWKAEQIIDTCIFNIEKENLKETENYYNKNKIYSNILGYDKTNPMFYIQSEQSFMMHLSIEDFFKKQFPLLNLKNNLVMQTTPILESDLQSIELFIENN